MNLLRGQPPWRVDALLVLLVWVLEVVIASDVPSGHSSDVVATVLYAGAGSALLLGRRRFPVWVLFLTLGHMLGALALVPEYRPIMITLVALYSVAAGTGAAVAGTALVGMYLLTCPIILVDELSRPLAPGDSVAGTVRVLLLAQGIALIATYGMGRWARATRQAARLRDELAEVERRDAVREERLRIAREMHDVVSHAVTTMTVQAAAARHLMPVDPRRAAAALERVEDGGSEAVGELRTMLGVLRGAGTDTGGGLGLEALGPLVERARRDGLWVRVDLDETIELPPELALVVVRVVQESLTNATKYAGRGAEVVIGLGRTPGGLHLYVRDDGGEGPPVPHPRSGGFGLPGLAERVAGVGGVLRAAPAEGRGFEVVADLPSGSSPRGSVTAGRRADSGSSAVPRRPTVEASIDRVRSSTATSGTAGASSGP